MAAPGGATLGAMVLKIENAWDVTIEEGSVTVHAKVAEGSYIDVVLSPMTLHQIQTEMRSHAQEETA